MRRLLPLLVLAFLGAAGGHEVSPVALLCALPAAQAAEPVRGLVSELPQYPDVAAASPAQRRRAAVLLADADRAARAWRDPRKAIAAGFDARRPARRPGDRHIGFLHAEHRPFSSDPRYLDPARPEVLIYANAPGKPLRLVGVMFSLPRGRLGAAPGGPITRWHSHLVCRRGSERGLAPRADGSCPPGTARRRGSEMMHLWFTGDLRSAFAISAPEPELCAAGDLPRWHCRSGKTLRTM